MAPEQTRPPLPMLTSVRFLAALWVAIFHMQAMNAFFGPAWFAKLGEFGYMGVDFFFVLSGFILVYSYWGRQTPKRDFWQARFARIYPALAFSLLLTAPGFFFVCLKMDVSKLAPEWTWPASHLVISSISTVLMLQTWIPLNSMAWHMPTWSLSNEAFFYFIFPFVLPLFGRLSRKWLVAVIAFGVLFGLSAAALYNAIQPDGPNALGPRHPATWSYFIYFNPLSRCPEFLMGMATGFLFMRSKRDRRFAWPLLLVGLGALAAFILAVPHDPAKIGHSAIMSPIFALMVYGIALQPQGLGILKNKFGVLLGDASYSVYLLHTLVIAAFIKFFHDSAGNLRHQTWPALLLVVFIICVASILTYKYIEEPLRRRLRTKRKQELAVAAPAACVAVAQ